VNRLLAACAVTVALTCGCSDDGATTGAAESSSTSSSAPATTSASSSSTVPAAGTGQGTLESAMTAVRQACRRHYGRTGGPEDRPRTEAELSATCDEPTIEWRSDCYADRPAQFEAGAGGCAYLGGYLPVWYGSQPFADEYGTWYFTVGDEVWTIGPESD
jgi:hypothetical protein